MTLIKNFFILIYDYCYVDLFQSYTLKLLFSKFQFGNYFWTVFLEGRKKKFREGLNPMTIPALTASSIIPGFPRKVRHSHVQDETTDQRNIIFCLKRISFLWAETKEGILILDYRNFRISEAEQKKQFLDSDKFVIMIENSDLTKLVLF